MNLPKPIVITNDDGIDAQGIRTLFEAVGEDAILVAPPDVVSGCSHVVTTLEHIKVEQRSEREYIVHGSPADCIRLAIHEIVGEIGCVLSGINHGGNLGQDIYLSGTVAGAREAAFHRIPAFAFSQYIGKERTIDWDQAREWVRKSLDELSAHDLAPGAYWNINFPYLVNGEPEPEMVRCKPCTQALPIQYQQGEEGYKYMYGLYHSRKSDADADVETCFGGNIAASLITL
jgi:5'-nucleotidase